MIQNRTRGNFVETEVYTKYSINKLSSFNSATKSRSGGYEFS